MKMSKVLYDSAS